ncbi:MAG: GGDEF domain-containing phosphodiesterase [Bacilli bacterium]|nr:GGDEF domain-containing phosphodiesterase [Bacilli bacterium]
MAYKLRKEFYTKLYEGRKISLFEYLNNCSYEELLEIDTNNDAYKYIYHTPGKYLVPSDLKTYHELFDYVQTHVINPEDRPIHESLMGINNILDNIKNSSIPNFAFGLIRYKMQSGKYRYYEVCVLSGEEYGLKEGWVRAYITDIHHFASRQLGEVDDANFEQEKDVADITGLLNGNSFTARANSLIKEQPQIHWALVSIDIEHFILFNEWFGKDQGDRLLREVGHILLNFEKNNAGIAGYLGSDDFALLMEYDMEKIENLYEQIRNVIVAFGLSFGFLPAFGVVKIERGTSVSDTFDRANIAATSAKKDVKSRIVVYDSKLHYAAEKEYLVLSEFMKAFQNREITFYLQPQCRISTGRIVGAEALARWIKPDGTIVQPNSFIPLLEKYGFIVDLDKYIWEQVCIEIKKWMDQGNTPIPISVNISRIDIFTIDVLQFFKEITAKYNIPHKYLKLEITESAYSETTGTIGTLVNELREEGFVVLMDDFGSGYSSLNMLSNLRVDAIKLDAKFLHIQDADYEKGIHILESVVNMAKQIALPIIVEGVETEDQCEFLEDIGCRYVQGFYFYKPMPIDAFKRLIFDPNNIDLRGFVAKLNDQFRLREFLDKNIYSDAMLNNIIGAVALYSFHDGHIDIVRFNQQFYEAVNVPDFHDKLTNIEQLMPEKDRNDMFRALEEAKNNKLLGAESLMRVARVDGQYTYFFVHFYYLGKKEGDDRFYGSAKNMTELVELSEESKLISQYSHDNIVFVRKFYDKWTFHVVSSGIGKLFNISAEQLEKELNDSSIVKRIGDQNQFLNDIKEMDEHSEKGEDFVKEYDMFDKRGNKRTIRISFTYVRDKSINIYYIMRVRVVD